MLRITAAAVFAITVPLATAQQAASPLPGFTAASTATERKWEQKFQALPEAKRISDNMHRLAAHPHNVGSAAQRANAEWMVEQYKSWGYEAHLETFDVLYPTPKVRILELKGAHPYKARLEEPPVAEDPYTQDKSPAMPPYNIYAADGDVTAPLVYVNYGMIADYDELARNNVSVKGAIVIARYGGGWRGLKPKLAYEHGAVGCIIYSDPADDGYAQALTIPEGPMRPKWGVQRGSVADSTLYEGDPLTPGEPSIPGTKRLAIADAPTIMKIPTLPISWGDAQPLLEALGGRTVPAGWRGALPMTYRFGPGPATVHLKVESNWGTAPVIDVIATMKGSEEPDTLIIRGNHADGWVNGADDPISGQSAMMEEARALGELHKQGWNPKRTVIYAAWDGEEPGLLGSTEWAEAHAKQLTDHAAIYINSDENGRGYFGASGSQAFEQVVNSVSKEMIDPETKVTVFERAIAGQATGRGRGAAGGGNAGALDRKSIALGPVGSGSDYASFIDHLGVSSINIGYGGEDRGGTYHSAYDTPWHWDTFADKDEAYGKLFAQTAGTLVMRIADSEVMPLDFTGLSNALESYTGDLKSEIRTMQRDADARSRVLKAGAYKLADDPKNTLLPPASLPFPPAVDFTALDAALARLKAAAQHYNRSNAASLTADPAKRAALNAKLALVERKSLTDAGLPGRPWVKNLYYAPGRFTGYGAMTLPGLREAVEDGNATAAAEQAAILAQAITAQADSIEALAAGKYVE